MYDGFIFSSFVSQPLPLFADWTYFMNESARLTICKRAASGIDFSFDVAAALSIFALSLSLVSFNEIFMKDRNK